MFQAEICTNLTEICTAFAEICADLGLNSTFPHCEYNFSPLGIMFRCIMGISLFQCVGLGLIGCDTFNYKLIGFGLLVIELWRELLLEGLERVALQALGEVVNK